MTEMIARIKVAGQRRFLVYRTDGQVRRLPIKVDDGLWLTVTSKAILCLRRLGAPSGQSGVTFACHFRETWDRLPDHVRRALLNYWGQCQQALRIQLGTRHLNTVEQQVGRIRSWANFKGLKPPAVGICADFGFYLGFHPCGDRQKASAAMPVIAHELAHAYRFATGLNDPRASALQAEEDAAEQLVEEWGFGQP